MHRILLASVLASALLPAQDLIHYKFDGGCTNEVINYAQGSPLGSGTIEVGTGAPAGFASRDPNGQFGQALTGGSHTSPVYYNRVKTGWMNPAINGGDFTLAFWMKERTPIGTSLSYMWSTAGSFRLFTGGVGGVGLYQRVIVSSGGNGVNATVANDLYLATDVQTLAAAGWVHIALVIDSTAQTAVWYINGAADTTITGVGGTMINGTGEVHLGNHSGTSGWAYDIDEFIVSQRAFLPAEIFALSQAPRAGAGAYDSEILAQCGSTTLADAMGPPSLGNLGYQLTVNSSATGLYSLLIGSNRCSFAGGVFSLPLDAATLNPLAAGCFVLSDGDFGGSGGGITGGPVTIPLPIPNDPNLMGLAAYAQVAVLDVVNLGVEASNGWALGLGF